MSNIWEFLYQTLSVSLAAAVLLAVKWLLRDKLSPRWQYAVWGVLALRALIPAGLTRAVVPQLALWIETAKSAAELGLASACTGPFEPMSITAPVPLADGLPRSLTDWLFALYAAGALAALVWYAYRYARLRALLWRGREDGAVRAAVDAAAEKYGLRACRTVSVPGLKGAFVCGVLRPVLAVPEGEVPDEKVILHELLHLKYCDAGQNVFWCVLRALHWCNPFLQYVFNRVGNDMEALCDQRVLERLEGEERREYGSILLGMASHSYARAPGTSSISNGARNIARRIEAIARFKLYPNGMALVSVCTVLILASTLLTGVKADFSRLESYPQSEGELLSTLAAARLERCSTVPGALDTYAKALVFRDPRLYALAAPVSEHERIYEGMEDFLGRWPGDRALTSVGASAQPQVLNLRQCEDGRILAELALPGEILNVSWSYGAVSDEQLSQFLLVSVEILREDGGYAVRAVGEEPRLEYVQGDGPAPEARIRGGAGWANIDMYFGTRPAACSADVDTAAGTVTVKLYSDVEVRQPERQSAGLWSFGSAYPREAAPDAVWEDWTCDCWYTVELDAREYLAGGGEGNISVLYEWVLDEGVESGLPTDDGSVSLSSSMSPEEGVLLDWRAGDWNRGLGPAGLPYYPGSIELKLIIDGVSAGEYTLELAAADNAKEDGNEP